MGFCNAERKRWRNWNTLFSYAVYKPFKRYGGVLDFLLPNAYANVGIRD